MCPLLWGQLGGCGVTRGEGGGSGTPGGRVCFLTSSLPRRELGWVSQSTQSLGKAGGEASVVAFLQTHASGVIGV